MEARSATGEEIHFRRTEFTDLATGLPVCVLTVTAPGRSSTIQLLGACFVATLVAATWLLLPTDTILLTVLASVGVFVILLLALLYTREPIKETVVVAHHVGVHVSKERLGGIRQTQFIPHSHIHDVIIHEAITMHRVIFYLALLLHTSNGHTSPVPMSELTSLPLFEDFKPRLSTLRETYDSIRRTLHVT